MSATVQKYRPFAYLMALLLFVTSAGFTVDLHYCQGKLKSFSFLGKAKSCHELKMVDSAMKNCPHHQKMMQDKMGCSEDKNCCSNKTKHFKSDQDQQIQTFDFVAGKQFTQFLIAYAISLSDKPSVFQEESNDFARYKPPLILRDIPVVHQSFLL